MRAKVGFREKDKGRGKRNMMEQWGARPQISPQKRMREKRGAEEGCCRTW